MRIPFSKVYRAFNELDRFGDAECLAWVARAQRSDWAVMAAAQFGGFVAAVVLVPVEIFAALPIIRAYERLHEGWWTPLAHLAMIVGALAALAGPAVLVLVARDWALRRAIRKHLAGARCIRCAYSLLGLPVTRGMVTCSECGERLSLTELGLSPEDILARPGHDAPAPASAGTARDPVTSAAARP